MHRAKPYDIPKREVWEAYKRVRANQGAAGVDGQTISDFEADLGQNNYKLWNRLSSGRSYEEANSGQRSAKLFSPQTTSGDRHVRIPLFRSAVRCSRRSRRHLRLDGTESVEMVDHLTVAGKR